MPLFNYVCDDCGMVEELLVQFSAPKRLKCPGCGGRKYKRQLSKVNGMLYRPDKDKVLETMKVKHTIVP